MALATTNLQYIGRAMTRQCGADQFCACTNAVFWRFRYGD
jgi:hypothetical protein